MIGAVLAITATTVAPAAANEREHAVVSDDSGITVHRSLRDRIQGKPARSGGGSECDWSVDHFSNSFPGGVSEYDMLGGRPTRQHEAYFVYCNGEYRGHIWRIPGAVGTPPRMIAEELVDHIPVPFSGIGINPTEGIAGLESWFWAEGYDGDPVTRSDEQLGIHVAVEATPATVTWDFGDGTPAVKGDLGRAYPSRSSVAHVYERSTGDRPFTVRLTINFDVRYQVDGGPWTELAGITRSQSRPYSVIQLQAVRRR